MWKNVHPVDSAGIQTHNLQDMSLLPYSLDQGSRPYLHVDFLNYLFGTKRSTFLSWATVSLSNPTFRQSRVENDPQSEAADQFNGRAYLSICN